MKMQNLADFLNNPSGKGSSIIMNREQIRTFLDTKYKALIDKHGDFKVNIYFHKDSFFYHILIPSESERKNTYDVVIQFVNGDGKTEDYSKDISLNNYYIKLFSNSPSFTYTYAYVYNESDCMVDQLQTKFKDDVLMNKPSTRNPGGIASYEKTTYFACKYLKDHKLMLAKAYALSHGKKGIVPLVKSIRDTDTIELEIAREKRRLEVNNTKSRKQNRAITTNAKKTLNTKINKDGGVTDAKKALPKTTPKAKITAKKNSTHVTRPKPKITAKKSTVKK